MRGILTALAALLVLCGCGSKAGVTGTYESDGSMYGHATLDLTANNTFSMTGLVPTTGTYEVKDNTVTLKFAGTGSTDITKVASPNLVLYVGDDGNTLTTMPPGTNNSVAEKMSVTFKRQ
jgi:uncharacterized protein YceK